MSEIKAKIPHTTGAVLNMAGSPLSLALESGDGVLTEVSDRFVMDANRGMTDLTVDAGLGKIAGKAASSTGIAIKMGNSSIAIDYGGGGKEHDHLFNLDYAHAGHTGFRSSTDYNFSEVTLTPKASSSGAEGTIFYCSGDNSVYVGVE